MEAFQSIEADPGAFEPRNTNTSPGFQRLRFNLSLTVQITDNITGFVDLGEEPNDFGDIDPFSISQDLGFIDLSLLGILGGTDVKENNEVLLRVGNIVTVLFNFRGYSDGAAVQDNPLIGNSPADMVTAESGIQLRGGHKFPSGLITAFNWDIGVTSPTFFQDFNPEVGVNVFGRASVNLRSGLSLGFGAFTNNLGDQVGRLPFREIKTTEMVFGDNENYNFPGSGVSTRATHSGLIPGLDARVFHIDVEYKAPFWPITLRGWYGHASDDFSFVDANGNRTVRLQAVDFVERESEEQFFGIEATVYAVPEKFYGAARYTYVSNESDGVSDDNVLDRIQVGVGWWFAKSSLVKVEYVRQNEEENSPGQIGADWDGFMIETSFRF